MRDDELGAEREARRHRWPERAWRSAGCMWLDVINSGIKLTIIQFPRGGSAGWWGRTDSGPGDGQFLFFPGLNSYDSKSLPISDTHFPTSPSQPTGAEVLPFLRSTGRKLPLALRHVLVDFPLVVTLVCSKSLSIYPTPLSFLWSWEASLFLLLRI